ncbi:hypothetical protein [Myxosarcina sp. GI1(2024)]
MNDKAVWVRGKDLEGNQRTLEKTHPYQLELFQYLLPDRERYSNTVELYDAIPRYFASTKKMAEMRENGKFLKTLRREFRFRNDTYQLEIRPARITQKNGVDIEYYPSEREQFVEEALWKIAHDNMRGCYLDKLVSVRFTLYELRQELARRGHSIEHQALLDALSILNRCGLTLRNESGKAVFNSPIFPQLLISSRADWLENPKEAKCYVQFNMLATKSLKELSYRLFDYARFMSLKLILARWLFKRLSHNFVQARAGVHYTIKASTIIRYSGLVERDGFRFQLRGIDKALEILKQERILYEIKKKRIDDPLDKRKIQDVIYELIPTYEFSQQTIIANKRVRLLEERAEATGKTQITWSEQKPLLVVVD